MQREGWVEVYFSTKIVQSIACKYALWGTLMLRWEKEGKFATIPLEFEYLYKKVNAKC